MKNISGSLETLLKSLPPQLKPLLSQHLCALLADMLHNQRISADTVLALEHVELALSFPHGDLTLAQFLDKGGTLIGTTLPQHLPAFQRSPLARRVQVVELTELSPAQTEPVLVSACKGMTSYYQISLENS